MYYYYIVDIGQGLKWGGSFAVKSEEELSEYEVIQASDNAGLFEGEDIRFSTVQGPFDEYDDYIKGWKDEAVEIHKK